MIPASPVLGPAERQVLPRWSADHLAPDSRGHHGEQVASQVVALGLSESRAKVVTCR